MSPDFRSTSFRLNGPAVFFRVVRALSLKESGVPMTSFGYSGVKRLRHSAYGLSKVTCTSRSSLPRSTLAIRSYPAFLAVQYAGSLPRRARHWAAKSGAPISRPSLHTAFWFSR